MKKIILKTIAILLIVAGVISSCKKKDSIQEGIEGAWVKETTCVDGTGDTIVFTNDGSVERYFKNYVDGYRIGYKLKVDTILISLNSLDDFIVEESFKYAITGNKLTIFKFTYLFSLLPVERENVIFRKIN